MKTRFKAMKLLGFVLVMVMIFTACSGSITPADNEVVEEPEVTVTEGQAEATEGPKMAEDQTYTFAVSSTVTSFDPHRTGGIPDWAAQAPLYENLVRYVVDENGAASYKPA